MLDLDQATAAAIRPHERHRDGDIRTKAGKDAGTVRVGVLYEPGGFALVSVAAKVPVSLGSWRGDAERG